MANIMSIAQNNSSKMTTQNSNTISDAQAYYLQAMGVDLYASTVAVEPDKLQTPAINTQSQSLVSSPVKKSVQQVQRPQVMVSKADFDKATLVKDICQTLGVGADEVEHLGDDYFKLGALQWRFVAKLEQLQFANNKLITEPLNKLDDVVVKRRLWQVLQTVSDD